MLPRTGSAHMPQQTIEKVVVHIVDDDEPLCCAVDGPCPCVGLETDTYRSLQEFLDPKPEGTGACLVPDVRRPGVSGLDFQSQLVVLEIDGRSHVLEIGHGARE